MKIPAKSALLIILLSLLALNGCNANQSSHEESTSVSSSASAKPSSDPQVQRDAPENATPLGLEIGYANLAGVKQVISANMRENDGGVNKFSNGPMYDVDGDSLQIDGLQSARLIFDDQKILQGVVLSFAHNAMSKSGGAMLKALDGKYKRESASFDAFMDNGDAEFSQGDSRIIFSAPHMAFSMDVVYASNRLWQSFASASQKDAQAARERKQGAL